MPIPRLCRHRRSGRVEPLALAGFLAGPRLPLHHFYRHDLSVCAYERRLEAARSPRARNASTAAPTVRTTCSPAATGASEARHRRECVGEDRTGQRRRPAAVGLRRRITAAMSQGIARSPRPRNAPIVGLPCVPAPLLLEGRHDSYAAAPTSSSSPNSSATPAGDHTRLQPTHPARRDRRAQAPRHRPLSPAGASSPPATFYVVPRRSRPSARTTDRLAAAQRVY